jgi:hypothetical protein
MKGHPSSSSFKHLYEQDARARIDILQAKKKGFSETNAGAIEEQK